MVTAQCTSFTLLFQRIWSVAIPTSSFELFDSSQLTITMMLKEKQKIKASNREEQQDDSLYEVTLYKCATRIVSKLQLLEKLSDCDLLLLPDRMESARLQDCLCWRWLIFLKVNNPQRMRIVHWIFGSEEIFVTMGRITSSSSWSELYGKNIICFAWNSHHLERGFLLEETAKNTIIQIKPRHFDEGFIIV